MVKHCIAFGFTSLSSKEDCCSLWFYGQLLQPYVTFVVAFKQRSETRAVVLRQDAFVGFSHKNELGSNPY